MSELAPVTPYLQPNEAARLLGASTKTVSRWADVGWLPCLVTMGGHCRFLRADVEELAGSMGARTAQTV